MRHIPGMTEPGFLRLTFRRESLHRRGWNDERQWLARAMGAKFDGDDDEGDGGGMSLADARAKLAEQIAARRKATPQNRAE